MAKSIKVNLGTIMVCCSVLFGLAAFFMMFAPAVSGEGKIIGTAPVYSGAQVIFGYSENDTAILNFNFLAFLGLFLLPLGGVICACASLFTGNKALSYVAAVVFVVGAVLAFFTVASFKSGVASGTFYDLYNWKLAVGPILSGIFGAVAGCLIAGKEILKK
ncbi:MAG: hypothetical protein IJ800_07410 [Clostridia bacterium]|nr:hypothetical protein [Clostridia bacterium]